MQMSQLHYLPLTPAFFSILVGLFFVLFVLIQVGALRYAYMRLGVSSGTALLWRMAGTAPETSAPGIVLACLSLVVMPPPVTSEASRRRCDGQSGNGSRRQTNGVLHLSVGSPVGWVDPERGAGLVVGCPDRRPHHGSDYCEGRCRCASR